MVKGSDWFRHCSWRQICLIRHEFYKGPRSLTDVLESPAASLHRMQPTGRAGRAAGGGRGRGGAGRQGLAPSKILPGPDPVYHVERNDPMGTRVRNMRLSAYGLVNSWLSAHFSLWTHCTSTLIGVCLSFGNDCLTLDKSGSTFCGDVCNHHDMWRSFTILPFFFMCSVVVKGFVHIDL